MDFSNLIARVPGASRVLALVLTALIGFACLCAAEAPNRQDRDLPSESATLRQELAALREMVEGLQAENAALQRENDALRRLLATRAAEGKSNPHPTNNLPATATSRPTNQAPSPGTNATPGTVQPRAAPSPTNAFWLSTWSGLRHTSGCRYYRNSTGRPCGPQEGKPCKLCGG